MPRTKLHIGRLLWLGLLLWLHCFIFCIWFGLLFGFLVYFCLMFQFVSQLELSHWVKKGGGTCFKINTLWQCFLSARCEPFVRNMDGSMFCIWGQPCSSDDLTNSSLCRHRCCSHTHNQNFEKKSSQLCPSCSELVKKQWFVFVVLIHADGYKPDSCLGGTNCKPVGLLLLCGAKVETKYFSGFGSCGGRVASQWQTLITNPYPFTCMSVRSPHPCAHRVP